MLNLRFTFFILFLILSTYISANDGRLLFLVHQGAHEQALKLYQAQYELTGTHDYDLLHRIGIAMLDYGSRQKDPEIQLLSLFGASVSAHEDVYYILEESLKSPYPQIQLVAVSALAHFKNDKADQALLSVLGSPDLLIRFEAVKQLCRKKHVQAVDQTESLLLKTPKSLQMVYPPLFAMVGDQKSIRALRRLLHHPLEEVRLAAILSIAKYQRDDLLPQIQHQVTQAFYAQQEASAYTLGILKDESSTPKLKKLTHSSHPTVVLAASLALYRLGHEEEKEIIKQMALKGNVYAVSILAEIPETSATLIQLLDHPDLQVRINALIALTRQRHPSAFEKLHFLLLQTKQDYVFDSQLSPGQSIKTWKAIPSGREILKDDISIYETHLTLRENLLEKVREGSETHFIALADQIFNARQNDLVPLTAELLEDLGSVAAIQCLKNHQQQLGAPLVRHYCNLALYRLQEEGPYGSQLRQWVKNQSKSDLIRFKPFNPWDLGNTPHTLTPEETSQLLIQSFEAFAINQDAAGIETLVEAMATGHAKNRYALAGLLLRATQ